MAEKENGRTGIHGTVRTTFLTDTEGVITDIITKVNTKDSANQILNLNK